MYRDDVCAVCGEMLPPDHLYCREHAAQVDDRLHEIGALLPRLLDDLQRVRDLIGGIAGATWDYLAEQQRDDPVWPPTPRLETPADGEEIDVDVDEDLVRLVLQIGLEPLLTAVRGALDTPELRRMAGACAKAQGMNATH